MQITSLISNDEAMLTFNLSIPTDDFVDRLDDFISFWNYQEGDFYPRDQYAMWDSHFEVNFTRILQPEGFCYTFNLPMISEFFHVDKLHLFVVPLPIANDTFSGFQATLTTRKSSELMKLQKKFRRATTPWSILSKVLETQALDSMPPSNNRNTKNRLGLSYSLTFDLKNEGTAII
jgi:hypothetical protein